MTPFAPLTHRMADVALCANSLPPVTRQAISRVMLAVLALQDEPDRLLDFPGVRLLPDLDDVVLAVDTVPAVAPSIAALTAATQDARMHLQAALQGIAGEACRVMVAGDAERSALPPGGTALLRESTLTLVGQWVLGTSVGPSRTVPEFGGSVLAPAGQGRGHGRSGPSRVA